MNVLRIGSSQGDIEFKEIPNAPYDNLSALQDMVGGWIEPVYIPQLEEQGIILLANEEGLLTGMEPNENLWPFFYVGPLVAIAVKGEDFTGLNLKQSIFIRVWLDELN